MRRRTRHLEPGGLEWHGRGLLTFLPLPRQRGVSQDEEDRSIAGGDGFGCGTGFVWRDSEDLAGGRPLVVGPLLALRCWRPGPAKPAPRTPPPRASRSPKAAPR